MATLGEKSVGSIVKFNICGNLVNFIVVNQGNPNTSVYDVSCNGTWLLMEQACATCQYSHFTYLSNNLMSFLDEYVNNSILEVTIPYSKKDSEGYGVLGTATKKVFVLSGTEMGLSNSNMLVEGSVLAYFNGLSAEKRATSFIGTDGTLVRCWTRSVGISYGTNVYSCNTSGTLQSEANTNKIAFRPAMVLSPDTYVDDEGVVGSEPSLSGYANIEGVNKELSISYANISESLPNGYTKVQYIESTGTQYINTGFKPNNASRIVLDIDVTAKSSQSGIFGARNGTASSGFNVWTWNDNAGYQVDYGTQQFLEVGGNSSGRHILDLNQHVFYVDGNPVNTATVQSFNCSYNAYLFTVSSGGNLMTNYPCIAKLYSCQIYNNGTLVRDFVPCTNPSGVAGLYDTVNDTFYTNEGTGTFGVGATLSSNEGVWKEIVSTYVCVGGIWRLAASATTEGVLPSGYTSIPYLQSSGSNYIDTGFIPDNNTRVFCGMTCLNTTNNGVFYGASDASNKLCFLEYIKNSFTLIELYSRHANQNNKLYSNYANDIVLGATIIDHNGNQTVARMKDKYASATHGSTYSPPTFTSPCSLYIFASNVAGTAANAMQSKLYFMRIYNNGTLVRDFIPCKDPNSVEGLYDIVNGQFYTFS